MNHDDLASLRHEWLHDPSAEVGRRLFEQVPERERPGWAACVLRTALTVLPSCPPVVANVLAVADDPVRWRTAHAAFTAVRKVVLRLDEKWRTEQLSPDEEALGDVLAIAELVAKVTYNSTNPRDEFDEDSRWCVAGTIRRLVVRRQDPTLERAAWDALTRPLS